MDEPFKAYLFEYHHQGSEWVFEIKASSSDDAEARVKKLSFARLLGEKVISVPASLGFFARVMCSVRNFFGSR